jgi:hypothetical protein
MTPNEERAFKQGMIAAACIVMKAFDNDTIATEILGSAGLNSVEDIRSCGGDDYDVNLLRACVAVSAADAKGCTE